MRSLVLASLTLLVTASSGCLLLFKDPQGTGGAGSGSTAGAGGTRSTTASVVGAGGAGGATTGSSSSTNVGVVGSSSTGGCMANLQNDAMNCGKCGHACLDTNSCVNGACDHNVFLTPESTLFDGGLGGTAGADLKCQNVAAAANLKGHYVAWLSLPGDDAIDRMFPQNPAHDGRIVNDGQLVANDVASMANGLGAIINRSADGTTYGAAGVLTNTGPDGKAIKTDPGDTCGGFLSASGSNLACAGVLVKSAPGWTNAPPTCAWGCAAKIYKLYCFEQD